MHQRGAALRQAAIKLPAFAIGQGQGGLRRSNTRLGLLDTRSQRRGFGAGLRRRLARRRSLPLQLLTARARIALLLARGVQCGAGVFGCLDLCRRLRDRGQAQHGGCGKCGDGGVAAHGGYLPDQPLR